MVAPASGVAGGAGGGDGLADGENVSPPAKFDDPVGTVDKTGFPGVFRVEMGYPEKSQTLTFAIKGM